MVALVLSMFLISVALILTGFHYAKNLDGNSDETHNSIHKSKTDESKQSMDNRPYYEKFVSSNKRNDFLDFSGGMLGI